VFWWTLRVLTVLLGLGLGGCRTQPLPPLEPRLGEVAQVDLRYRVTYVREPAHALEVVLERGPGAPVDFLFTVPGDVHSVRAVSGTGEVRELAVEAGGVSVPRDTRQVRYRYALETTGRRRRYSDMRGGQGEARVVSGQAWLLRPRVARASQRAELWIHGAEALLPWTPAPGGGYRLTGEDLLDAGFHGFGVRRCQVEVEGGTLEVGLMGDPGEDETLCTWVRQAAREVLTVRRRFPYARATVLVVPVPGRKDSGIFGRVWWSMPPSVALLVGEQAPADSFSKDWIAVHELLHLAHPVFLPRVPWLSEGLATYYTEVAKARSGRHSVPQAWAELLDGFARGRAQVGGMTLEEVAAHGSLYQGLYWSGALLALHLDVELRRLTGNRECLEAVLERLGEKGPTSTQEDFGATVDALAGQPLFEAVLRRHLSAPAFSEQQALLDSLGVQLLPEGPRFVPAPLAPVREALMVGACGESAP
jgi:hypothetical protein